MQLVGSFRLASRAVCITEWGLQGLCSDLLQGAGERIEEEGGDPRS